MVIVALLLGAWVAFGAIMFALLGNLGLGIALAIAMLVWWR